jgi:two-component system, OmpR family, sensor histidine kinase KdpD
MYVGSFMPVPGLYMKNQSKMRYVYSLLIVGGATLLARLLLPHFAAANLVMIYLLAVVLISAKLGRGPAVVASLVSVCIFDFFCIEPYLTFAVSDSQYLLTFGVMLTTALVISNLTSTAQEQAERATKKEQQTALLYSFSRELADGRDLSALAEIGQRHMSQLLETAVDVFIADPAKENFSTTLSKNSLISQTDRDSIEKVYDDAKNLDFRITASTKVIPLKGSASESRVLGAVFIQNGLTNYDRERFNTLEAFISQLATACDRTRLSAENEQARVQVKAEQLRSSLLSSISHDLRTPLATITGAASGIMEAGSDVKLAECRELATEIFNESRRLNRLVGNLLDMTRVESGALEIRKEPQPVDEIIGSAISYFAEQLESRTVETEIPEDLPMISGDDVLIQQLLINLMENVFKYTPADSPLLFRASFNAGSGAPNSNAPNGSEERFVTIELSDRGPGIPEELREQIFQKFVRATNKTSASGAGLGLAICQGIVEAHGGRLGVNAREGGGATFWFALPVCDTGTITDEAPRTVSALEAQGQNV